MNSETPYHPEPVQLAAFLDGRMQEADRVMVERHIADCDRCCQTMSELPQDTLSGKFRDVDTSADSVASPQPSQRADASKIPSQLVNHPRYRILGLLGKGGMGVVYKAQHRMMDRDVALKVIDARFIENLQAIERFRTEVKAAARLSHANIVRAYDAEQAGNLHFLVMEFVDGISLAEVVRRNGPLPVRQACGVIRKVAQGLHHAFEQGMVHRDIKPQNIMVTHDGRVRILDFGLARLARERETPAMTPGEDPMEQMKRTADALTLVGSVLGTPDYIAPEQALDAHQADTRSDIYSLGCTAYALLTGHPPYPDGTAMQKLLAHADRTPSPISEKRFDVPDEVIEIVSRMMERNPDDRYQTPRDVAKAVDQYLNADQSSSSSATRVGQPIDATVHEQLAATRQSTPHATASHDPSVQKLPIRQPHEVDIGKFEIDIRDEEPLRQKAVPGPASKGKTGIQNFSVWTKVVLAIVGITALIAVTLFFNANEAPISGGDPTTARIVTPRPAGPDWVNLIPQVDPTSAARGQWQRTGTGLSVDQIEWARIQLTAAVPEEYDFEIAFTRHSGVHSIALIFVVNGHQATLDVDAWAENLAGIQNIDGQNCRTNPTRVEGIRLINGQRYTTSVRVRRDRVEAYFEGKRLTTYHGDGTNLSLIPSWNLSDDQALGLGAYNSATTFHFVRIRPVGNSEN